MKTTAGRFFAMPNTKLGWSAVGLMVLFVTLFTGVVSDILRFSGFLTMAIGLIAALLILMALIWKRERSWLIWLMLLPGLFAILFALGEILYPH